MLIVEANVWGNTVESAAVARAVDLGRRAPDLASLVAVLDGAILAVLPSAVEELLGELQERAALSADVRHLMDALPALARIARYGDVRGTNAVAVTGVFTGLFERVTVGLLPACASLDDDAASAMVEEHGRRPGGSRNPRRPGCPRGMALRSPAGRGYGRRARARARLCVSPARGRGRRRGRRARETGGPGSRHAVPPAAAAGWIEGLLRGSGLALLHQDGLWRALDEWLLDLSGETFVEMLPLLRRAFSGFAPAERRQMGEKVRRLRSPAASTRRSGSHRRLHRPGASRARPARAREDPRGRSGGVGVSRALPDPKEERPRRWRLVLGAPAQEGIGASLAGEDVRRDAVLEALYDSDREAGLGSSSPNVARWLGDIRTYFPTSVVRVMQQDALERLEPEADAPRARDARNRRSRTFTSSRTSSRSATSSRAGRRKRRGGSCGRSSTISSGGCATRWCRPCGGA